jgi:hypothetical protein
MEKEKQFNPPEFFAKPLVEPSTTHRAGSFYAKTQSFEAGKRSSLMRSSLGILGKL